MTAQYDRAENPSPTTGEREPGPLAGRWYFVVTALSGGFLAWVPFAHAASRLHRRSDVRYALVYGAASVVMTVLMVLTPTDEGVSGDADVVSVIGGMLVLTVVAAGCVQQFRLRREVYGGAARRERGSSVPSGTDPAVAAVLAARERRAEARRLAASDPLMARELRIGRPDLPHDYDDGGLVDLNNAPATVIAEVCDLDIATAEDIVAARSARGGFLAVDDVFTVADVPLGAWDVVRDRGVVITG